MQPQIGCNLPYSERSERGGLPHLGPHTDAWLRRSSYKNTTIKDKWFNGISGPALNHRRSQLPTNQARQLDRWDLNTAQCCCSDGFIGCGRHFHVVRRTKNGTNIFSGDSTFITPSTLFSKNSVKHKYHGELMYGQICPFAPIGSLEKVTLAVKKKNVFGLL